MQMDESPTLLSRAARSALDGLRLLAQGLAILLLGLVAAVTALVGAAARLLGEMLSDLVRLLQAALPWLLSLAPWLLRAAIVTAGVLVVVNTWPAIFIVFGGDLPAAIPATVFAFGPLLAALQMRSWGALVAAIVVAAVFGRLIPLVGPLGQALLVITGITLTLLPALIGETDERHGSHGVGRQTPADQPVEDQPVGLHGLSDVSLSDDDPAV